MIHRDRRVTSLCAGGVAGSAIIALYTVPTIYMIIVRSSMRKVPVRALASVEVELAMTRMAS